MSERPRQRTPGLRGCRGRRPPWTCQPSAGRSRLSLPPAWSATPPGTSPGAAETRDRRPLPHAGAVPLPRGAVSRRVSPVPASLPNGHFGKQQGIAELWGQSVAGGPAPCAARRPQPACGGRSVGHCGAESHVPLDLRAALGTDRPRPPVPPGAAHFPSPVSGTEVTGWRWEAGREVVLWVTLVLAWGTPKAAGDASFPRGHAANPSHPTQDAPPHRARPPCRRGLEAGTGRVRGMG